MASLQQTYLIGSRQKLSTLSESLELSIDNVPIKQVSTTKWYLLMITWYSHIHKLSKKIASGIGAITRIRPLVAPWLHLINYITCIMP